MRLFPVIETFGPTIQGEGALAGTPTLFVRFGGCDYRCTWCDSMYAVDPAEVRENAEKLSVNEILGRLLMLQPNVDPREMWVTLSGGNPALMRFATDGGEDDLCRTLHGAGFQIAVETQGSVWRDWLLEVDHLTVSPKPPSSGMASLENIRQTTLFMKKAEKLDRAQRSLKVVVFDDPDYRFAQVLFMEKRDWAHYLSVGTDQEQLQDEYRVHAGIAERYRWLAEQVASDPEMRNVRVLPQLHVIAFGTGRGV